jgi:CubicO group peptidase (beta-lactamase class C family)
MQGIIAFVTIVLFAYGIHYCWLLLPIISGYGTKYMCSSVFTTDLSEQQLRQEDLGFFPMKYATFIVDYNDLSVTGSIFGLAQCKAIYRHRLGATLINELTEEQIRAQTFKIATPPDIKQDNIPWPMGDKIDDDSFPSNINQTLLQDTINDLFIEKDPTKLKRTRAVIVVYDGKLIAERYAPGFSRKSKLLGWSMTKSLISALIGILVKDKKINIDEPAPVPEWNNTADDPRHSITIKNLLQQMSGLDFKEEYYTKSDVTQMLFNTDDMAAFAASHPLKHPPDTQCYYTSGNTNILSRIIRHTVGENEYHSFPYRKLFYKLGMNSLIMEVDASGTFVGSSYSWGTARDWARFGLLYQKNGFYNDEQILSEEWIKQTTALAGSNQYGDYGYHFWLNTGKNNVSSTRRFPDVPIDMFYASGFDGQATFIIPSKKLVVVRLGLTKVPGGEYGANDLLKNIISSIE